MNAVNWTEWVTQAGAPPVTLDFSSADSTSANELADGYISFGGKSSPNNSD